MNSIAQGTGGGANGLSPAHALASLGMPIVCGRLDSAGDPDTLDRRWKSWQKMTPGARSLRAADSWREGDALAGVTGVVYDVLDVDPRNGGKESLEAISSELGDSGPDIYWKIRTPRGGLHLYVAPLGIGSHNGWRPGLDLKGGNSDGSGRGFVFLPPTERYGKRYRVLTEGGAPNGDGPSVALRDLIERSLGGSATTPASSGRVPARVLRRECLEAGNGDQRRCLMAYVYELERMGISSSGIISRCRRLMKEMPAFPSRKGPWYPARRRDPDFWIKDLMHGPGEVVGDATAAETAVLASLGSSDTSVRGRRGLLSGVRTGSWLEGQEFEPLEFAIPGLLPAGLVVIAGPPFAGKGLLVLRFVLECARGGSVFGVPCDARPSFYVALEDSDRRMQDRCRDMLDGSEIPSDFSYVTRAPDGKLVQMVGEWLKGEGHSRGIVVIDTLGKVQEKPEKGEGQYDRDYRIMGKLTALSSLYPGACIVVNTHTRKSSSKDFVDMISGTNAIAGAADTALILERTRGSAEGMLRITSRDLDEAEYALLLARPGGWKLEGDSLLEAAGEVEKRGSRLDKRSQSIIDLVNCSVEITAQEVSEELGLDYSQVRVYMARHLKAGYYRRIRRGVYGPARKIRARKG